MSMYSPLRIHLANLAGTTGKASPRMNGEWFPSHLICLIAELYESLCFVRTLSCLLQTCRERWQLQLLD